MEETNKENNQETNEKNVQETNEKNVQETNEENIQETNEENVQEINEENIQESKQKKQKKRIVNMISNLMIIAGIVCFLYGGVSLYNEWAQSKEAENSHESLKEQFVTIPALPNDTDDSSSSNGEDNSSGTEETQKPERPREWYEQIQVDLVGLQTQVNPDIIGWIHFENEDISYPLLYSEDNAEYQRVRYDLEYSKGGSIFLESSNSWDLSDIRNVIYGHNMKDESMFGKLKRYNQKKNYYEDHQYFQLLYDGMVYRYQIFSYFTIHQREVEYVETNFTKGSDKYKSFLKKLVKNSKKKTDVEVDENDKTVTLVTCAPDNTYRFIVSAVLVDQHAMVNADGNFPDEPDTELDSELGTESETESESENSTERPGSDEYTYTPIGKTMWATDSVKIRNKPTSKGVQIAILGEHGDVYVEAICNETGWYRVRYGSNRRKVGYINSKYLTEKNLHTYTGTKTKEETCTEPGEVTYKCECGDSYVIEIQPHHTELLAGEKGIHSKCSVCGEILQKKHSYVDKVVKEATTTEEGTLEHICGCGYSYTEKIPKLKEESQPPSESEVPGESETPSENEVPSESEVPGESETPSESEAPSESEVSGESETSGEGEIPSESEAPSETPGESEVSSESEIPSESEVPSESRDTTEN